MAVAIVAGSGSERTPTVAFGLATLRRARDLERFGHGSVGMAPASAAASTHAWALVR